MRAVPVVAGAAITRRQIVRYTLLLVPTGLAPWFLGYAGLVYGVVALTSGAIMLTLALQVGMERRAGAAQPDKQLFAFSILYLFLLFAALLVEQGMGVFRGMA